MRGPARTGGRRRTFGGAERGPARGPGPHAPPGTLPTRRRPSFRTSDVVSPAGVRRTHLDVAAPAYDDEGPYAEVPYDGTGFVVRTPAETPHTPTETLRALRGGAPDAGPDLREPSGSGAESRSESW
ncbi:hypothetical protein [Streptomyces stelliscabiei]|uniref:hypothetical protein n=1 Tax=Streptomyces stelliscabiei TaxID=146820 RepID=UPI0029AA38C2|nr:hypothetical protein [Streptomyces stelliscabiei]MDX2556820.1 hypothetical protein [Streptomyces stelliscabiei]MDX2615793.1 hypothetical protein [Streptomyces stelliscabiei]MDX2640565.1 hypothetical protein [Streptomyces stelliscabiei]MDX2667221.1 hypothetical protein [Streptomyces stelliscabiei]MDX2716494.1 hypothetical protein [Streptomyces stelliscabiei]